LLAFNDQVLPRANHRLKTLQDDISQTKPTFLLKEQVINAISEGKFYLKAGKIDRGSERNRLREVVIYDLADPTRRRTIYADSGAISLAANRVDLNLDLYHGQMQEVSSEKPGQLNRLFYDHDLIRIKNVAGDFRRDQPQSSSKGDREMSVCEMQRRLWQAQGNYEAARREYEETANPTRSSKEALSSLGVVPARVPEPRGLAWAYCRLTGMLRVKEAQAAEPAPALQSARRDTSGSGAVRLSRREREANDSVARAVADSIARISPEENQLRKARTAEAKLRLDIAQRARNRYDIEIHKKFSLAAACIIFVLIGAPIAVRFPRGGVGLVIGVSLLVFALYYVGLIGGESLANEGIVPPFWAMWGTNVILSVVGIVLLLRMGKDSTSNRGGDWSDRLDALLAKFGRGPQARLRSTS
jgi:lipopolysaccharide export system permease protein